MKTVLFSLLAVILIASIYTPYANAQFQAGGVQKEGSWYVGEGLKKGDLYSYEVCHIYYKDCTPFKIDFWVEGDKKTGSETQWLIQVVVYDGGKTYKGTMMLGKLVAEPAGSSPEVMTPYAAAFKSSLSWLSAYATADATTNSIKGPKHFTAPSWGKIGNIGGEQIIPYAEEKVAVPDGIYDTVVIQWKTGGKINRVWVVDDFPFPVKADTYAHVAQGVPPQEYRFDLQDYQKGILKNPFEKIKGDDPILANKDCPTNTEDYTRVAKNTNTNTMIIEVNYAPPHPMYGCEMDVIINFKRSVNQEEFENEVHYDFLVVQSTPEGTKQVRSIADEEHRNALFTTSGQVRRPIDVMESGKTTYAIYVKGTGPETAPDSAKAGFITFDVDVQAGSGAVTPPPPKETPVVIPSWIKNNARFWADGKITDKDFVSGLQYLINQKIIKIPTTSSSGTQSDTIPSWIKNNARFWADGKITDKDFVSGIQYLITNGIIKLKS